MKSRGRKLIVALCVAAGIILAVSVVLRLFLTRERLMVMIVPRIEKAVDAKIEIGDIGVRFPFGFGVDARDLSFEKKLPAGVGIDFASRKLVINVSLWSLIRKHPDIKNVEVEGGVVVVIDPSRGINAQVRDLKAWMSMEPSGDGYHAVVKLDAGEVELEKASTGEKLALGRVSLSGILDAGPRFEDLSLTDCTVEVDGLAEAAVAGKLEGLSGEGVFSATVESSGNDVVKLYRKLISLQPERFLPQLKGKKLADAVPFDPTGGTIDFRVEAGGSLKNISRIKVNGSLALNEVSSTAGKMRIPVKAGGAVEFSTGGIRSERIDLASEGVSARVSFDLPIGGDRKPGRLGFNAGADMDVAALTRSLKIEGTTVAGKIKGEIKGKAALPVLSGLFPSGEGKRDPAVIAGAWKNLELGGKLTATGISIQTAGGPLKIFSVDGTAVISGGDVSKIEAGILAGHDRWRVTGSMKGLFPCLAELSATAGGGDRSVDLAKVIDSIRNVPDINIDLSARSFDARPFQELKGAEGEKGKAPPSGAKGTGAASKESSPALAGIVPFLKRTGFSVAVDSVITRKAVFTSLNAKGAVRDGMLNAYPVGIDFAGGKGRGKIDSNLRNVARINTRINIVFENIEASQALRPLHKMGSSVSGLFSFKVVGDVDTGPGIDPLMSMDISGNASSSGGVVDLSEFISPLAESSGMKLESLKKVKFNQWTGSYRISGGRFSTEDWLLKSSTGDWSISGSFGLDGTLAYKANLKISPAAQKGMKDLDGYRDLLDLFRDDGGNLVFDFDIGGTAKSPKIRLDQSRAKARAGEKLIDGLKKGAADKLKDLFKKD